MGVRPRSASATRARCRRSTAGGAATCSTRSSPRCPTRARRARRTTTDDGIFSVAIVGRPNVGKSTLFNRLVGDERSVVHDMPGTTRDAIDTIVETEDGPLRFVDTAGMRRRSRIDEPTEYFSLVRALEAIDRADAALLVIDATEGVTHQDQRLAERVDAAGTAIVIVLNKWDLLDTEQRAEVRRRRRRPARVPLVRAGAPDLGAHRPAGAPAAARAARGRGGVPPARPDRGAQPGAPRRPGRAPAAAREEAPAPGPLRHPGRDRPAHVHAVRDPDAAPDRTCGTSSARSASRSTSARRRSSSGSGAASSNRSRRLGDRRSDLANASGGSGARARSPDSGDAQRAVDHDRDPHHR